MFFSFFKSRHSGSLKSITLYIVLFFNLANCNFDIDAVEKNMVHKIVEFKFVASPNTYKRFIEENKRGLQETVRYTIGELESALNGLLTRSETPMKITFNPIFDLEVPPDISLDTCGSDTVRLGSILNSFNVDDSKTSLIVMLGCRSEPYKLNFSAVGVEVPHITHTLTTECTTRTLIFLEMEGPKQLSAISTALMRAAGVTAKNPLMFEEANDGDQGVRYEIQASTEAIDQLRENWCFVSSGV
ncbi:Spore wall protein [Dictyocoela roeselum]|nr:Spore wall protein [Dictyocoela roeselum]